jgi:hypothetical protein
MAEEYGAEVPLTEIIKRIIKDYPQGTQILKELLQNGDDAKARYMTFLFDMRTHMPPVHGDAKLVSGEHNGPMGMAPWQGPALLVL